MRQFLTSPKLIVPAIFVASVYMVSAIYLMNAKLVGSTIVGAFPLGYKITLLINLLGGMWTAMTGTGLLILAATAILTGINLSLIFQRLALLSSAGNLHLVVGGSSLLGIVGSGCAACGLPILALLGLSGSIAYLPFRGTELSIISVILLSISLYLMVRSQIQSKVCITSPNLSKI